MLQETLLKTIGISDEDTSLILEQDAIYGKEIEPLAQEYWKTLGHQPFEPYVEQVFPGGSNLKQFAHMFDLYLSTEAEFADAWRVFGKMYEGTTKGLPADNTLRRNFITYINNGGTFGNGSGVILYDGEQKKIINK